MKNYLSRLGLNIIYLLIFISCFLNLPKLCAFLIKVSLFKPKFFRQNRSDKKVFIVLNRKIGIRDLEIIHKSTNFKFEFLFLKRSIVRVPLYFFRSKKKSIFNYYNNPVTDKDFFNQNERDKKNHEKFWYDVIYSLKNYFIKKNLNFITFNYTYPSESALFAACKKNDIPVKLWHKEGVITDGDAAYQTKKRWVKFRGVFKNFTSISVYNELIKKKLIEISKENKNKITVNGCPRTLDYILKKKYYRKPKTILLLFFNSKRGIPNTYKNKNLNWMKSQKNVIKILNELSKNKYLNIIVKVKSNYKNNTRNLIDKRIKIFKSGTAENYIYKADIIIGHNSSSTIESIINGKYVMVPFFEKNSKLKKYLLNFNDEIIYTSQTKMKNKILNLINKKSFFPLNYNKHNNTINYYFGSPKNVVKKYLNFLNN
tara:strand:+ start:122 stop:1402 length:1281 start_codon:yes stop_codon:yes gene_type:complete